MSKLLARSPAKLNLTFEILGLLPNGYHQVATLLQAVDLYDELTFEFTPASNLEVVITSPDKKGEFPLDESNLIARAARLFWEHLKPSAGARVSVSVEKRIPIGAGLAGGSGNAAATLLALNHYFTQVVKQEELLSLAAQLGSDVPFCLQGGTCIGRGRGDELTTIKNDNQLYFCLLKPRNLSIPTPWVYKAYDAYGTNSSCPHPDMNKSIVALQKGDLDAAAGSFGNVFEPLVFHHHRQLQDLQKHLLSLGVWCCHLSGSGPSLYALVPNLEAAHAIRRKYLEQANDTDNCEFHIVSSINHGAQIIAN